MAVADPIEVESTGQFGYTRIPVSQLPISDKGSIVHLKGYGLIKVFKIVSLNGNIEYWATSDLSINELFRLKYAELSWSIEVYHQGIKQFVGVERCFDRKAVVQRNHIGLALRAFLRIEPTVFQKASVGLKQKY